jgi:murein DD-endopeptidase MepM/ murein hydrolase activator NlpD
MKLLPVVTLASVAPLVASCAHAPPVTGHEETWSRVSVVTMKSYAIGEGPKTLRPTHEHTKEPRPVAPSRPRAAIQIDWPADGPLSSPFGMRDGRPHEGIDLAVPDGTEVHAALEGVVAYAGDRVRGYGKVILLEHPGGLVTVYAHNSELLVKEKTNIARGQVIAHSGHTGRSTAPHVHFEVRENFTPRDPLDYLPPRPVKAMTGVHDHERSGSASSVSTAAYP